MPLMQPVTIIRESFRAKIFTLCFLMIVLLSVCSTILFVFHERKSQINGLFKEGDLLAGIMAYNARLPVYAENTALLKTAIDGLFERSHVLAVSIFKDDGRLLAERVRTGSGIPAGIPVQGEGITTSRRIQAQESVEFLVPVIAGITDRKGETVFFDENPQGTAFKVIGLTRVVLDKKEMNRRIETILVMSIITTVIFLIIVSLAAYYVVGGVTQPLQQLAEGVCVLGLGDLSARVSVDSRDEIGRLAVAFNSMAATLERREGEKRRLEEELRLAQKMEAKEEWERTFDTVPDLIAIVDREDRIVRVNRTLAMRLNISKEDAAGKCYYELITGGTSSGALLELRPPGEVLPAVDEIFLEKLGSYFWITASPLRNIDGKLLGAVHVARDITERKRAEDEQRQLQAKLIQANKMTSLGLLVSGMAHEVNNPNNNIKLAANLLAKAWVDVGPILEEYYRNSGDFVLGGYPFSQVRGNLPEYITGIMEGSRRIEGIIKNLRDFARKGKATINSQADVNMVVSVAAAILNYQIKKHTRAFSLDLCEGLPLVSGNQQLLEQVVINLIMNAIQSLPDKDRQVQVSTLFDSAEGWVIIKVHDEGCGMSQEVRKRLFEPFFSTRLESGGTGLGLAISQVIITEHQGTLEFDSIPERWTTATIKLPVRKSSLQGLT